MTPAALPSGRWWDTSKMRQTLGWVTRRASWISRRKRSIADLVVGHLRADRLQGDPLPELQVLDLVDLAHAAPGDEAHDPVALGDERAGRERGRRIAPSPDDAPGDRSRRLVRRGPEPRSGWSSSSGPASPPGSAGSPPAGWPRPASAPGRRTPKPVLQAKHWIADARRHLRREQKAQLLAATRTGDRERGGGGRVCWLMTWKAWRHCYSKASSIFAGLALAVAGGFWQDGRRPRGHPLQGDSAWRDDKHGFAGRARWPPPVPDDFLGSRRSADGRAARRPRSPRRRRAPRAKGPFARLILRGVTLIDGTGAPPMGPVDIVIEKNRIAEIVAVGSPGVPIDPEGRPKAGPGDREMDLHGPVRAARPRRHARPHRRQGAGDAGRVRLQALDGARHHHRARSRQRQRPRLDAGPEGEEREERDHRAAHRGLRLLRPWAATSRSSPPRRRGSGSARWPAKGADGLKFFGNPPEICRRRSTRRRSAACARACHHAQMDVARVNVLTSARWGLTSMEHWYGLPEALFTDRTRPGLPARLQLHRRVAPLRPGRPALEAGRRARLREVERGDRRADRARLHARSDPDDLRGEPRPHARAPRRVARGVHPALALGLLQPEPPGARLLLVQLDDRGRGRLEGELPPLDGLPQRLQEPRRPGDHRLGQRLHLQALRLRLHPRAGAAARGRLPSAGGDPRRHARTAPRPWAWTRRSARSSRASSPTWWSSRRTRSRT